MTAVTHSRPTAGPIGLLASPRVPAALVIAGTGALVVAFASQHWGGLAPCELCLWQRWAYAAAIGALMPGMFVKDRPGARAVILVLGALAFLAGAGIAFFHAGVEQGWWTGLTACANPAAGATSVDDLLRQLEAAPIARCDEIPWSFLGLSMAGWNVLAMLGLAAISAVAARLAWAANARLKETAA